MSEMGVNTDGVNLEGAGAGPATLENFRHHRWNHGSLTDAARALAPSDTAHAAAQWQTLARDVEDAAARFRASVEQALRTGWTGTAAAAVESSVGAPVAALDGGAQHISRIARIVADAGSAMSTVVAAMPDPAPAPDPVRDWNAVLPWNWQALADADATEQQARDVFTNMYAPAQREAADALRVVAVEAAAAGSDAASPESTVRTDAATEQDAAPAMDSGTATGMGALAGAAGGFAAQYGRRIVAAHHAEGAESTRPAEAADDDTEEVVEPVFLEKIDDTTQLTGDLPPVARPVIGER